MNSQDRKSRRPPASVHPRQELAGEIDGFAKKIPLAPQLAQAKRPFTILCVDDESQLRNIEKRIISPLGHDVETAKDGVEALERVKQGGIDLVLSDFSMPRMNGVKLAQAIHDHDPNIRVIIVSGGGMKDEHYGILQELGVTHILPKPLSAEDIKIAIDKNLPPEPSETKG